MVAPWSVVDTRRTSDGCHWVAGTASVARRMWRVRRVRHLVVQGLFHRIQRIQTVDRIIQMRQRIRIILLLLLRRCRGRSARLLITAAVHTRAVAHAAVGLAKVVVVERAASIAVKVAAIARMI